MHSRGRQRRAAPNSTILLPVALSIGQICVLLHIRGGPDRQARPCGRFPLATRRARVLSTQRSQPLDPSEQTHASGYCYRTLRTSPRATFGPQNSISCSALWCGGGSKPATRRTRASTTPLSRPPSIHHPFTRHNKRTHVNDHHTVVFEPQVRSREPRSACSGLTPLPRSLVRTR